MSPSVEIRSIAREQREAVLDLLRDWLGDRDFFARYFSHDPTFRDELCFVALQAGKIVGTLQVFRKRVRIEAAVAEVAALGNVFTSAEHRSRGIASALLAHAARRIRRCDFDLSLLFSDRHGLYERHGWRAHPRQLSFLDPGGGSADPSAVEAFVAERDLDDVMGVYDRACARVPGSTVRDSSYWRGQLRYAGNPDESFLLRRAHGAVVAYARSTSLYGFHVVTEHACLPGHDSELADLISHLHARGSESFPGTILQLTSPKEVVAELAARGLYPRLAEDTSWMWSVTREASLAAKLGWPLEAVRAPDFLTRVLPPERSLYWLSDRF